MERECRLVFVFQPSFSSSLMIHNFNRNLRYKPLAVQSHKRSVTKDAGKRRAPTDKAPASRSYL